MKRTELYLDEEMARILDTLSRQQGTTVSQLVTKSLRERYMPGRDLDKVSLARERSGIWRRLKDLKEIDRTVRNLRKGSRLKRRDIHGSPSCVIDTPPSMKMGHSGFPVLVVYYRTILPASWLVGIGEVGVENRNVPIFIWT